MPFIQKVNVPPTKQLSFAINNFSGGLNNREWQTKPTEGMDIYNMRWYDLMILEKRYGTKAYDSLTADGKISWIDVFSPYQDTDQLIRGTATSVYAGTTKIATVTGDIHGVTFDGMYIFFDGSSNYYCYAKAPQTSTSPYITITGTPINSYQVFKITNPPSGFTPLDTTHDAGVTVWNYTTMTVHYEPCQNELADAFKGSNVLPNNAKYCAQHAGRLYVAGDTTADDTVYITDIRNPFYFAVALPVQLTPNGDKVTCLAEFDDSMMIARQYDVYILRGNSNRNDVPSSDEFQLIKLNTHTGFANNKGHSHSHNWIFFLGSDGVIYSFGQTLLGRLNINEGVLATTILSPQLDLFAPPFNLTTTDFQNACAYFHDEEWNLNVKTFTIVYSFRTKTFTVYNNINMRSCVVWDDTVIWGRDDGQSGTWDTSNYLDFGEPFHAHWTSGYMYMGDASYYKQIREFYITAHTFDNFNSDVKITFEGDYEDVSVNVNIANQLSVFGKSHFGDRFIDKNINASIPFIVGKRIRAMRITLGNSYDLAGTVATYSALSSLTDVPNDTLYKCTDTGNYYLFTNNDIPGTPSTWQQQDLTNDLNQPMRVYAMNGDYELRGRR